MDYMLALKCFGDYVGKFSPEFCEKHFKEITTGFICLTAVPAITECIKHYVDKTTYCRCFVAAANNGLLAGNPLEASDPTLLTLPTTA